MSINKFGVTLRSVPNTDTVTCKNYVRRRTLCLDGDTFDARNRKIRRLADAANDDDAVNKAYLDKEMVYIYNVIQRIEKNMKENIEQLQHIVKNYYIEAKENCDAKQQETMDNLHKLRDYVEFNLTQDRE